MWRFGLERGRYFHGSLLKNILFRVGDLLPYICIWVIFCHISGRSSATYLEEMRIRLSQASIAELCWTWAWQYNQLSPVELGLGLSLAIRIMYHYNWWVFRAFLGPKDVKVWFGFGTHPCLVRYLSPNTKNHIWMKSIGKWVHNILFRVKLWLRSCQFIVHSENITNSAQLSWGWGWAWQNQEIWRLCDLISCWLMEAFKIGTRVLHLVPNT